MAVLSQGGTSISMILIYIYIYILLSLNLITSFYFLLVYVIFSSRCMLESKIAIKEQKKSVLTGSRLLHIDVSLAPGIWTGITLSTLIEESLTQASVQEPSQPFLLGGKNCLGMRLSDTPLQCIHTLVASSIPDHRHTANLVITLSSEWLEKPCEEVMGSCTAHAVYNAVVHAEP